VSCWSGRKAAFDADDERLLEMMASSVATAIIWSLSSTGVLILATMLPNEPWFPPIERCLVHWEISMGMGFRIWCLQTQIRIQRPGKLWSTGEGKTALT